MSRRHDRLIALALGGAAAALSIGRLLLANPDALRTLVWAEDGLFPLCSRAEGPLACLADPYAGYLLFLPRVVAIPLGALPLDWWPAATNIAAAVLAGLAAPLVFLVARRFGTGVAAAIILGLLPVLAPIMGFEAINATGSSYMLVLYVVALATCLVSRGSVRTSVLAVGMAIATLTIPSSVLLLPAVAYQAARKRLAWSAAAWVIGAGAAGALAQAWVVATAEQRRALDPSGEALLAWADGVPSALLTFVPGRVQLADSGTFTAAVDRPWVGVAGCVIVVIAGLILAARRDVAASAAGLLLLLGLALGALPATIGYANNRYFVIPALLWSAVLVIGADRLAGRWRDPVLGVTGLGLLVLWWSAMPASTFRSASNPEWPAMLESARATCLDAPAGSGALTFTPGWPFADAVFVGPTSNVVPCTVIEQR